MNLNERIAKVLGWKWDERNEMWIQPEPEDYLFDLPDWATDLNLMLELEEALTKQEREIYGRLFVKQVEEDADVVIGFINTYDDIYGDDMFHLAHATASTKAKAWLRVKEKGV